LRGNLEKDILQTKNNIANCLGDLGRVDESLKLRREIYAKQAALPFAHRVEETINLAMHLNLAGQYAEAKTFLRREMPEARRALEPENQMYLGLRHAYAHALFNTADNSMDDRREAVAILEDIHRISIRVLGPSHPVTRDRQTDVKAARDLLAGL